MCDNLGIPDSNEPKHTVFLLSDESDVSNVVLTELSAIADWISGDIDGMSEEDLLEKEYTITVRKMTEKEISELPEYEG